MRKEIALLQESLSKAQSQNMTSSENVTAYENKLDGLALSLSEKENRVTELEAISVESKLAVEKLSADLENTRSELVQKDTEIEQLKADRDAKMAELTDLTKKQEEMKHALQTAHKVS